MPVDPLERITNLLALLLETREPLSQDRIVHELSGQYPADPTARRAAFERDKAALRAEGVVIEQTYLADGGTGYRIDRSAYELGDLGLSDDEKRALQLAMATVHLGVDWGDDALRKLAPEPPGAGSTNPVATAAAVLPSMPALAGLFAAHAARCSVSFSYRGRARRVDPLGLLSRGGNWYLVGYDHSHGEQRVFRVDRVEGDVEIGDAGSFEVPDGFDPSGALATDMKAIGGVGDDPTEAVVRIDSAWARRVVAELGPERVVARQADGTVLVRVPCTNRSAFRSWVLGMLEHAEVLEPPEVRAEVVGWLEAIV
ncbi:MAG: helix-turn-helix transcriptional regulator [Acidimicrobiales bacterium]